MFFNQNSWVDVDQDTYYIYIFFFAVNYFTETHVYVRV